MVSKMVDAQATIAREVTRPRGIWYMGAKARVIPGFLDTVLREEVPAGGTIVDLMSGSGVVSAHCARRYRVFAADVQRYAAVIAASFIECDPRGKEERLAGVDPLGDLDDAYRTNLAALEALYSPALAVEAEFLAAFLRREHDDDWARRYREFLENSWAVHGGARSGPGQSLYAAALPLLEEESVAAYRNEPGRLPACLVTAYYANVYFGLRQALQIDSLRIAIERFAAIDTDRAWRGTLYLSALLHAASVSTSGTSHFAQPRHLTKDSELRAMAKRRTQDARAEFDSACEHLVDVARSIPHREGNRAFAGEFASFVSPREEGGGLRFPDRVDCVYLDPPYTADHYSRFYHVLEVLTRFDYPELKRDRHGAVLRGRYPAHGYRFQSGFCRRHAVEGEFARVIAAAAASGAKLVISYASPSGLLLEEYARRHPGEDPVARFESLCRRSYRRVETRRKDLLHSGQGDSAKRIEELLVICARPR